MVTIKAAAELTGLTVKAIRHYEQIGLVQPPLRTDAGYRLYSTENIFRLRQIQYYRELKFSLQEIGGLLDAPQEAVRQAMMELCHHLAHAGGVGADVFSQFPAGGHALSVLQIYQRVDGQRELCRHSTAPESRLSMMEAHCSPLRAPT